MTNPLVNVVYAGHGADVRLTMCDGRTVYRDGAWPTLDVEARESRGGRPHLPHHERAVGGLSQSWLLGMSSRSTASS